MKYVVDPKSGLEMSELLFLLLQACDKYTASLEQGLEVADGSATVEIDRDVIEKPQAHPE